MLMSAHMSTREMLEELLTERILFLDGAMGTMIQAQKLTEADFRGSRFRNHPKDLNGCNDLLVLTQPRVIEAIHRQYLEAGSDIIETNTFNATALGVVEYGLQEHVFEINKAAAEIARRAAEAMSRRTPDEPRFVAGSIGPTNKTLSLGVHVEDPARRDVTFDDMVAIYEEQIAGLVAGGVDLLLAETSFDTLVMKACLFAIDKFFAERGLRLPVMVSGTIFEGGRGLSAQSVEAFWVSVSHFDTYADTCRAAAERCWNAAKHQGGSQELAWWVLAAIELRRTAEAAALGNQLLALQTTEFIANQKEVRGFWRMSERDRAPYTDAVHSALPPLALQELARALPEHRDAGRWRDAVRLHVEEYVLPMTAHSAYATMPFGVFLGSPTTETYRPLAGELTYRYFMPVRKQFWWLGMTSHLESYAVLLAGAGYRDLALRQLEWIMGANPFGACLMTGEGMRNPYPHSRFVGLIPGGIMNGIAGNAKDAPILDMEYGFDWRTTEYWSPHNAYYLWAVSALEAV